MERGEAAAYLGVSVRTLDRIAAKEGLTKGRDRRKTRPVTVFDPKEIERLKVSRGAGAPKDECPTAKSGAAEAVGFRLSPHYIDLLSKEASRRGMSPGDMARQLVIQSLEGSSSEHFSSEVLKVRQSIAHVFYTFLVMKCGETPKSAQEFVRTTVLRDGVPRC